MKNVSKLLEELGDVKLVIATKNRSVAQIQQAYDAGARVFGENRVQDAREKIAALPKDCEWHMIGHLQSNKVKDAVRLFDVIQTIDSGKLAEKINTEASALGKRQKVMIQINISDDLGKHGLMASEVAALVSRIKQLLTNLDLTGLMTITSVENRREDFKKMKELFDRYDLQYLSMGMSDSYKAAIEEGSNMVRIGRDVFE